MRVEPLYYLRPGSSPLLVNVPHCGVALPPPLQARMTANALELPDTDWHVDVLYDFAESLDATILAARYSRYVVDLNRDPQGIQLYADQNETEIVPTTTFDLSPIYARGNPFPEEVQSRIAEFWIPYHLALREQIERLLESHDTIVLWDAHSIPSRVPRFFEGELPELNIGTAGGESCDSALSEALITIAERSPYTCVFNGRFQGGYITRHYGEPSRGVNAVQLELAQRTYLREARPQQLDTERSDRLRGTLHELLEACISFAATARRLRDR